MNPTALRRICFYARFLANRWIRGRDAPLILGLSITDYCNLHCHYCRVANITQTMMPLPEVEERLRRFYALGYRELYLTGGEPLLWHDGDARLNDVIALARSIGYFSVALTTNGTIPLKVSSDVIWVSLDGTKEIHEELRGRNYELILRHLRLATHPKLGITCTITANNRHCLREFLRFVAREGFSPLGVMFYFHTPYYGKDDLFLNRSERAVIIDKLLAYKQEGLPVFNSVAALQCLKTGDWKRPTNLWLLTDADGDYECCRHRDHEICEECGYSSCVEVLEALRLRPSAVKTLMALF